MTRSVTAGLFVLTLVSAAEPARAEPATPGEAARLTALFERYVGHGGGGAPSSVTVVPHGEAYTVTLDVTRMLAPLSRFGFSVTAGDLAAELAPQPDGRWHVTVDGFPPVGVSQDKSAVSFALANYAFDGVFDPTLQAFATATTRNKGSTSHSRGQGEPVDVTVSLDGTGTMKAEPDGEGTVTATSTSSNTAISYRITKAPQGDQPAGAAPAPAMADIKMDALTTSVRIDHERVVALDDLWQFLVAHPSKQALLEAQADLKAKLHALVPFGSGLAGEITASKVAAMTPLGPFGLDSIGEQYSVTAAGAKDLNAFTLRFAGLTLPSGLVPPWAAPLVPTSLDLTNSYGPLAIGAALSQAIDVLDLAADKPLTEAQQAAIMTTLGLDDATITIAPSTLQTATLALKAEGLLQLVKPLPTGSVTIAATGLDKTIEAVRAAAPNDPNGVQAIAVLMAAKALAKAEGPDSYSWAIVAPSGGDMTVNGNALAAMARSQQPEPAPPNATPESPPPAPQRAAPEPRPRPKAHRTRVKS